MNREEFISIVHDLITEYSLDVRTTYILAGGALILHGLRETTGDIDLQVSSEDYACMASQHSVVRSGKKVVSFLYRGVEIEIATGGPVTIPHEQICYMQGLRVQNLKALLAFKLALGRTKDAIDILRLQKALNLQGAVRDYSSHESPCRMAKSG